MRDRLLARMAAGAVAAALSLPGASGAGDAAAPYGARVTNGVLAQDRPTTGALLSTSGNNHRLICSGTLIGCRTFLTAAHCVCDGSTFGQCGSPSPSSYSVYLQDVGIVGVSSIEVDPSFAFGWAGDVAVLTLSSATTGVAPTPINTSMRPPFGSSVEIAGYGLTHGGADDTGMLRRGLADTGTCVDADPDHHVCWSFESPLGEPGVHSNTCNGDSGGPLFADLGDGTTVVGITSGGTSNDCMPSDHSYDTDVYVHRAFIQGAGGADIENTSCGSIAQVGGPGATRATFDFDTLERDAQACRKEVAKETAAYAAAALRAWHLCLDGVNAGSRAGPCPDAATVEALQLALAKVDAEKLGLRCPEDVVPRIHASGACAAATAPADLAACIAGAVDAAVAGALDAEYADDAPSAPISGMPALVCQRAVARAGSDLLRATLKAATRCQVALASGKSASCPDAKAVASVSKAESKAAARIVAGCSDEDVAALDAAASFGGSCSGVTTSDGLASCERVEHESIRDGLVGLLADRTMGFDFSFAVPAGAAELRVSLNGRDTGENDLDLYVRRGSPATKTSFDARSENGGMFEEARIVAPAAGTWHVHLERFAGDTLIPYQITATAFAP